MSSRRRRNLRDPAVGQSELGVIPGKEPNRLVPDLPAPGCRGDNLRHTGQKRPTSPVEIIEMLVMAQQHRINCTDLGQHYRGTCLFCAY